MKATVGLDAPNPLVSTSLSSIIAEAMDWMAGFPVDAPAEVEDEQTRVQDGLG